MILVVGATGQLGGLITQLLLNQGLAVRILVRPNSAFQPLVEAGAQPIMGDLKDQTSLEAACQGIDALITTANSAIRGGEDTVETVDLQGNRNLIKAAKKTGVKQFIFVSVLGADVKSQAPFVQAKAQTEAYLKDSGIPYTILSPDYFMESWIGMVVGMPLQFSQPITLVGEGNRVHSFVSAMDVAAFATKAIGHPAALQQQLAIGGPQPLSWRDILAAFERELDRKLQVQFVSPGETVPNLPETVTQLLAGMDAFDSPLDMTETAHAFDIELTSLEKYIKGILVNPKTKTG